LASTPSRLRIEAQLPLPIQPLSCGGLSSFAAPGATESAVVCTSQIINSVRERTRPLAVVALIFAAPEGASFAHNAGFTA
jgi:hypothetical protein